MLAALAAVLRSIGLDQQLWYDEMTTLLDSVRHPLGQILTSYDSQNVHMLYSILARISIVAFGEHAWSLRLPAMLAGVAGVPLLYLLARQITSQREALLAAALLALSYHHVWFSQNARGYTLMVVWTLLGTHLFLRAGRDGRVELWPAYGLVMALGMYTHLTMAFVLAGHAAVFGWALLSPARRGGDIKRQGWLPIRAFLIAGGLAALLYAPVLPKLLTRTVGEAGPLVSSEWTNPLWLVMETLRGLAGGENSLLAAAALAAAGGIVLAGMASYGKENRYMAGLMIFPGVITGLVMFAVSHNLWPRFFFFAIGFAFLFLLRGVTVCAEFAARKKKWPHRAGARLATAGAMAILAASAWTVTPAFRYPKQDFAGAMQFIEQQRQAGEAVLTAGLAVLPYQRFYQKDWAKVESAGQLEAYRAAGRTAWVVYTLPIFLESREPEIWNVLQREFDTVRVFRGTLGGGEVVVCKTRARPGGHPPAA